jgi:hypothetical protein
LASKLLKRHRHQRGAVMIEMALTFSIFMLILLALFEFAILMFTWSKAVEATRLGSRYAVVNTPVTSLSTLNCSTVQKIEVSCGSANCGVLKDRMTGLLPQLNASQIHVTYACSNTGYAGAAAEYRVYDVTVAIRGFSTTLAIPGILGFPLTVTMPDFATTRTSEDLHTP